VLEGQKGIPRVLLFCRSGVSGTLGSRSESEKKTLAARSRLRRAKKGSFSYRGPVPQDRDLRPSEKKDLFFSRVSETLARLVGSGHVRMTSDLSFLVELLGPLIDRDTSHRVVIASSSSRMD